MRRHLLYLALAMLVPCFAVAQSESSLKADCMQWFNGKKYAAIVKNATYYYRFGRRVTYTFTTAGAISSKDGKLVCEVNAKGESDDRTVWEETYFFDGRRALFIHPKRPTTDWLSLTPQGNCLLRDGRFRSNFGFGPPDEPDHIYKAGEAAFCPA